ncbi:MAG: YlxR family protein [Actinomycetota bacterium]|nr:YlxR family protein [Actinomycetota bacterium]
MRATDRTGPRDRTPTRTCVGCRRTDSWSALLRVVAVRNESGGDARLVPDPWHRLPGRGAWLHPSIGCFEQAVRRRAFARALRLSSGVDTTPVAHHLVALSSGTPEQPAPPHPPIDYERPTEGGSDADEHSMSTQQ